MEAARVAALRGHRVTLWEKRSVLGGNLIPAAVPDFKMDYRMLIEYLSTQIHKLGVVVELGKEATAELIEKMKPDVVFIATGSTPNIADIPGITNKKVITAVDLMFDNEEIGKTVAVIGGGLVGAETALYLAQKGHEVTIIEILDSIAQDMFHANRQHLLELLAAAKVRMITGANVIEINDEGVVMAAGGGKRSLPADSVVLAMGSQCHNELSEVLRNTVPEVYAIGDCIEPGKVINAIWGGFRTARLV
jgi:2-enoate reductase